MRVLFDLGLLARHLRLVHFALRLRRQIRAGAHRQRAGQCSGESRREHDLAAAGIASHAGDDAEDGAEPVVDAVDRVADPSGAAHVPALAAENGVERGSRRRNLPAGQRSQDDGVIALLDGRFFRDQSIGRIAQARHQLLVFRLGLVFLLLEAVQHDVRIGNPLEPRQPAPHLFGIGHAPGRGGDPLRPARGMLVLLLGEAEQDVAAFRILLAVREMLVGGCRFDFAAPHLLDRRQVELVDRHYPMSLSNRTTVPMPAAISSTCRRPLASISPRCRSGIRSDIAMYSRLADETAST